MHASHLVRCCAVAALTAVIGCSTTTTSEPSVEGASEALRALAAAEILGDLQYGQTSPSVAYTETPKYRAFRFLGRPGDAVDAWVRSTNGDARAWLLDASFLNVVSNDDADASTRDSHLVTTLTKGGAYYIAFREATLEDASFTISLQGTNGSPATCDPEVENCPTPPPDGDTCTGTAMTSSEAILRFQPGTSASNLGPYTVVERHRTCNPVTGCGTWSSSAPLTSGTLSMQVVNGKIEPRLAGNDGPSCTSEPHRDSTCSPVNGSETRCQSYSFGTAVGPSGGCQFAYLSPGGFYIPGYGAGGFSTGYGGFEGIITSHCARLTTTGEAAYDSRTKSREQYEAVLLARY